MHKKSYLFTSESVSEGHPDKVCDRISDMVVDTYLAKEPFSRVGCETLTTTNKVVLAGETRGPEIKKDDLTEKVRSCIKDIGYEQKGFHWKNCSIDIHLHSQSTDIAMGVDSKGNKDDGAGDQGIMFGYACDETEVLMPAPIYYSHKILELMAADRKNGKADKLEPDSKSQVTLMYENGKPVKVTSVVISTQHSPKVNQTQVKEIVRPYLEKSIPKEFIPGVEKGIESVADSGILAGFPLIDYKVTIVDGLHHDVDSSVLAFEIASRFCFKEACTKASLKLLEPMMRVEVVTPEDYMGDVIGDLNSRRGQVSTTDKRGNATVISAMVPLANMFGYINNLRSMSQGRASYSMFFDHYEKVPQNVQDEVTKKLA